MKNDNYSRAVLESQAIPGVVPGIYNYCDRWCFFCQSKTKCSLYVQDLLMREHEGINTKGEIMCIMEVTKDFIEDHGEELGMEWCGDQAEEPRIEPEAMYDDLNRRVSLYAEQAINWVQVCADYVPENEEVLGAMHIVGYYTWIIMSKIIRASLPVNEIPEAQLGRNGSAKVALISLDKSLGSMVILYEHFSAFQDEILSMMKDLSCIIDSVEYYFPDARYFKRPGLDV
ncbi:MAG TPA: hypothetical protein VE870_12885 [Bacteroidales bacterium]|nr:hypothetical protein [Bacteroidales bacterium]